MAASFQEFLDLFTCLRLVHWSVEAPRCVSQALMAECMSALEPMQTYNESESMAVTTCRQRPTHILTNDLNLACRPLVMVASIFVGLVKESCASAGHLFDVICWMMMVVAITDTIVVESRKTFRDNIRNRSWCIISHLVLVDIVHLCDETTWLTWLCRFTMLSSYCVRNWISMEKSQEPPVIDHSKNIKDEIRSYKSWQYESHRKRLPGSVTWISSV